MVIISISLAVIAVMLTVSVIDSLISSFSMAKWWVLNFKSQYLTDKDLIKECQRRHLIDEEKEEVNRVFNKERMSELMKQQDVTYEALAAQIGVSKAFVGYLLRGYKEPSLAVAKRIADFFGVTIDELTK